MPKKYQLPPNEPMTLELVKCSVCDKQIGYIPVAVSRLASREAKTKPVIYCSTECAEREFQEDPTKVYGRR